MHKVNYGLKDENYKLAKELIEQEYYLDAIKILQKLHKNHSDSHSLKFSLALAWADSEISLDRAEKYFQKIIKDDGRLADISRIELSRILLRKREYTKARENLECAVKYKKIKLYASSELLYLAIREEKYEEAYMLYKEIMNQDRDYFKPPRKAQIETYLSYKLGKNKNIDSNYYFGNQLLNYNEDKAIEHIKAHLDEDDGKIIHSTYLDDVNVEELYEESKIRITSMNLSAVGAVDKYRLSFDKTIGILRQEEVDAVSVITFPNTYDILSIYPVYNPKTRVKKV